MAVHARLGFALREGVVQNVHHRCLQSVHHHVGRDFVLCAACRGSAGAVEGIGGDGIDAVGQVATRLVELCGVHIPPSCHEIGVISVAAGAGARAGVAFRPSGKVGFVECHIAEECCDLGAGGYTSLEGVLQHRVELCHLFGQLLLVQVAVQKDVGGCAVSKCAGLFLLRQIGLQECGSGAFDAGIICQNGLYLLEEVLVLGVCNLALV